MYALRLIRKISKVVMLMAFLSAAAEAASTYSSVTVVRLHVFQASSGANPGTLIIFSPPIADSEGCTKSGQGYAWIDWTSTLQPDGKALYTTVLAAAMAGKTLDLVISGCSQGYYPLVYQVVAYP